jgi:hypothetical protein
MLARRSGDRRFCVRNFAAGVELEADLANVAEIGVGRVVGIEVTGKLELQQYNSDSAQPGENAGSLRGLLPFDVPHRGPLYPVRLCLWIPGPSR